MAIEYLEGAFGKFKADVLVTGRLLGLILLIFCLCDAETWSYHWAKFRLIKKSKIRENIGSSKNFRSKNIKVIDEFIKVWCR